MMTRKHFRETASLISSYGDAELRKSYAEFAARMFELNNPRFDRERFYIACGVC